MPLGCLQFPPKNERKQGNLRFHSSKVSLSKVEFVRSFFGGNVYLKKSFRLFMTFTTEKNVIKKLALLQGSQNLGYTKKSFVKVR